MKNWTTIFIQITKIRRKSSNIIKWRRKIEYIFCCASATSPPLSLWIDAHRARAGDSIANFVEWCSNSLSRMSKKISWNITDYGWFSWSRSIQVVLSPHTPTNAKSPNGMFHEALVFSSPPACLPNDLRSHAMTQNVISIFSIYLRRPTRLKHIFSSLSSPFGWDNMKKKFENSPNNNKWRRKSKTSREAATNIRAH